MFRDSISSLQHTHIRYPCKVLIFNSIQINQTGEVPTKRKNKAYAVIKNEMEERERAKKRASKNVVCL